MTPYRIVLLGMTLMAPIAVAQQAIDVAYLRSKAVSEGSVEVKVTTRAVADTALTPSAWTDTERSAIQRVQHRILIQLISRGLVVGNEINMEPDGSFTMRVLPGGLNVLAASIEVAALDAAATPKGAQR